MPLLRLRSRRTGPGAEIVTFFDEAQDPVSIRDHLMDGAVNGEGLLLLLKPFHWEWLRSALQAAGIPVEELIANGRLVYVSAEEQLASIQKDGEVHEALFHEFIEPLWHRTSGGGQRRVRAVGELVGLLWRRGEHRQAFALERMWQRYLMRHDMLLLLAFRIRSLRERGTMAQRDHEDGEADTTRYLADQFDVAVAQAFGDEFGPRRAVRLARLIRWDLAFPQDLRMGERTLFWVQHHFPERSYTVIERARALFNAQEA